MNKKTSVNIILINSAPLKLAGFYVERKISQEEIEERFNWIELKRSKSNLIKSKNFKLRPIHFPEKFDGLYRVKFSSQGDIIATTYGSGCIQVRNGETGDLRATIRTALETSLPVTCCCFHPIHKESLFASSTCGRIFHCQVDNVEFWKFLEEFQNEIYAIDINVTGENIISGGKDTALKIYDSETAKLITHYKKDPCDLIAESAIKYHSSRIFAVKCFPTNSNLIATGGWDDTVKIWDMRVQYGSIRSIHGPHICGDAIDIRDAKIVTGSWVVKNSLQLWDMTSAKLIETINPTNREPTLDGEYLYCAQFFDGDPCGDYVIVGGSGLNKVEVISLKEKKVVTQFDTKKAVSTIDSFRRSIVYGGMDRTINIVDYN